MKCFLSAVLILLNPQEKNDAEVLFRKMEDKILNAKTIRIAFSGTVVASVKASGEFLAESPDLVRIDMQFKATNTDVYETMISDGKQWMVKGDAPGSIRPRKDIPKDFSTRVRTAVARAGFLQAVSGGLYSKIDKATEDLFTVSDFKLVSKEKADDKDVQKVTYTLKSASAKDQEVAVWINLKTLLPVRRRAMAGMPMDEAWTTVALDEKIDPAKFEFPKESK